MSATALERPSGFLSRRFYLCRRRNFGEDFLGRIYLTAISCTIILYGILRRPSSSAHMRRSIDSTCTKSQDILVNFSEVRFHRSHLRLARRGNKRKPWAAKKYSLEEPPGVGHYALLGYLSSRYRHTVIVDVGTRWGDSARALAAEPSNFVFSFDVMNAAERIAKANSMTISDLESQLGNIQFFQSTNILKSKRGEAILKVAQVILLDTAHQPDHNHFEYDFITLLDKIEYKGLLICDDIHLNDQMERWWNSILHKRVDVTEVGHSSGTGIVDFSGNRLRTTIE